jgi:hypothetical protein
MKAGHLGKTFKPNELSQNEDLETQNNKALKGPLQITQSITFLTPKEIQNIIKEDLNPRIAPGYDLITGRINIQYFNIERNAKKRHCPSNNYRLLNFFFTNNLQNLQ